jgi:hypothetical protein
VGLLVASASIIAAGFVTKASHLVATIGCLYPFAGALYLPCATLMYEWFVERRGLASGILFAGTGIGGTIFPLVVGGLLGRFGYRAAMVSLGLAFFLMNAVALMFIKRRVPLPAKGATHALPRANFDWGVLKTSAFWLGMAALLLTSLGNFNPTLWIPSESKKTAVGIADGSVRRDRRRQAAGRHVPRGHHERRLGPLQHPHGVDLGPMARPRGGVWELRARRHLRVHPLGPRHELGHARRLQRPVGLQRALLRVPLVQAHHADVQ